MKKNKLFWTPFALKALDKIADYLEKESHSKNIAEKSRPRCKRGRDWCVCNVQYKSI